MNNYDLQQKIAELEKDYFAAREKHFKGIYAAYNSWYNRFVWPRFGVIVLIMFLYQYHHIDFDIAAIVLLVMLFMNMYYGMFIIKSMPGGITPIKASSAMMELENFKGPGNDPDLAKQYFEIDDLKKQLQQDENYIKFNQYLMQMLDVVPKADRQRVIDHMTKHHLFSPENKKVWSTKKFKKRKKKCNSSW